jgi:hypothetical protein
VQRTVETRIARALVGGEIQDAATITLAAEDDELVVLWNRAGGAREEPPVEVRV